MKKPYLHTRGGNIFLFASATTGLAVAVLQTGLFPSVNEALVSMLEHPENTTIARTLLLVALWFAVKIGAHAGTLASKILQSRLVLSRIEERKNCLFRRILHAKPSFHAEVEPERILERLEEGIEESVPFSATAPATVSVAALSFLWALWQMFAGSPRFLVRWGLLSKPREGNFHLAVLAVATACIVVAAQLFFEKHRARHYRKARGAHEDVRGIEAESLRGIQDLRSAGAFPFALRRISAANARSRMTSFRFHSVLTLLSGAGCFAFCLAESVVLAGAARLIFRSDVDFTYSNYIGFSLLCGAFNSSALELFGLWQEARKAMLARDHIREFDTLEMPFAPKADASRRQAAPSEPITKASLDFRGISFTAPDGTPILRGIDLSIRPGEHVALVGPSGCGKSTLLKLAMRHLDPSQGEILFAGAPLQDCDFTDYASHAAYVSQHPFLFDGTIRENILMGRSLPLDDSELLALAEDIGLLDDLRRKASDPAAALDLPTGPEGRSLSGGQAAKVALCRALAGNPNLLLLDEVTASLDELSQERVARFLAGPKCRAKTILSISHRLPAVRGMSRIVVLDGGRIVQQGTWNELAARPGLFSTLLARETDGTGVAREPSQDGGESRPGEPHSFIRALSLSPVFADLDSQQLFRLVEKAGTASIPAASFLFRKGDAGDSLFVVASGQIEINGNLYGPGYTFGEIAIFGGLRRTADVRAVADSQFLVLRRDDVFSVCKEAPDIAIRLLGSIARIAARA